MGESMSRQHQGDWNEEYKNGRNFRRSSGNANRECEQSIAKISSLSLIKSDPRAERPFTHGIQFYDMGDKRTTPRLSYSERPAVLPRSWISEGWQGAVRVQSEADAKPQWFE